MRKVGCFFVFLVGIALASLGGASPVFAEKSEEKTKTTIQKDAPKMVRELDADMIKIKAALKNDINEATEGCEGKTDGMLGILNCVRSIAEGGGDLLLDMKCDLSHVKDDILKRNKSKMALPCLEVKMINECNKGHKVSQWFVDIPVLNKLPKPIIDSLVTQLTSKLAVKEDNQGSSSLTQKQCRGLKDILIGLHFVF